MRRSKSFELLPFEPEIERTLRKIKKETKQASFVQQETMANNKENRALRDYAMPIVTINQSSIRRPAIQANNFEIKRTII